MAKKFEKGTRSDALKAAWSARRIDFLSQYNCGWDPCRECVQHLARRVFKPFFVIDTSGSMSW